ncbi:MAG: class I SAM-dependent DNA methyltransferase, partial [Rubrobacter sp.]|nr:class I SAM-dependent DNA methyltransferase [Rubrobacter sp.]
MVDRDKVLEGLRSLDGDHALRRLLVRVFGYEGEGGLVSGDGWPEELDGEPELFATAGREGRFAVIRARLNTPGRLSLTAERRTIERLRERYPYALYVFSDAEDRVWHFVNALYAERAGGKQYRRMVIGPDEELRTATDRISMLSMDDLAEKPGKESDELSPLEVQAAHDKAFDVERVTKEFFREYASVFARVEGLVEGIVDPERKRLFTQRLFNRLMFLAFIQKKGWLRFEERQDYLPALFEAYSRDEYDENFYRDRLKHLFFTGLNTPDEVDIIGINEGGYLRDVIG